MTDESQTPPKRTRRPRNVSVDVEAKAIGTVYSAVKELPPDAVVRVFAYVQGRLRPA